MGSCDRDKSSVLNPVDDPEKRPFGAPGIMYACYAFFMATGFALLANYAIEIPAVGKGLLLFLITGFVGQAVFERVYEQRHDAPVTLSVVLSGLLATGVVVAAYALGGLSYLLDVVLLFVAAGCYFESLALIFFEPSVMLGDDLVHYRARKPSVWTCPPRMFRWSGGTVDEELSFSSFTGIELDYTRVPFPLPVYPFTRPVFHITRWVLTMKRDDGTYYLLEVGPTPEAFREVSKKVSEFTELPLRAPWFDGFRDDDSDNWVWFPDDGRTPDARTVLDALRSTGLPFDEGESGLAFPVENRMSTFGRSAGLLAAGCCLIAGMMSVFAGFQYDPNVPSGLLKGIAWMLSGAFGGLMGILLLAGYVTPVRSRLCFDGDGVQVIHPVGQSSYIRYEDLIAIRGVHQNEGSVLEYGLGKPVPCLEVYGEQDWFYISLHDPQHLDEFQEGLRNLT